MDPVTTRPQHAETEERELASPQTADSLDSSHFTSVTHESLHEPPAVELKRARGSQLRLGVLWMLLFMAGYLVARFENEARRMPGAAPEVPTAVQPLPTLSAQTPAPPPQTEPVAAPVPEPPLQDVAAAPGPALEPQPVPFASPAASVPIRFTSNAREARVLADGTPLGRVGETILLEANRTHRLLVTSPTHKDRTIELDAGDGSRAHPDYYVALESVPAVLQITARAPNNFKSPRRAEILVDGVSLGDQALPFLITRETEGPVSVGLRAVGFEIPADHSFDLEFGSHEDYCFNLEHPVTRIRVMPTPSDAKVYVGNREVDPSAVPVTPGLVYAIRIEAEGYRPLLKDVVVNPGETHELRATLKPYTYFQIETDPPEASLFMNGKRLEDRTIRVTPDTVYFIDARAKGYKPFHAPFQAAEGTTEAVQIRMQRKLMPF